MLHERFGKEWLTARLLDRDSFRPYPAASQRDAWEALDAEHRRGLIAAGEDALARDWPALPASVYLGFFRSGNRDAFETLASERRGILKALVMAECAEGQGRFGEAIMDALWSTCEESIWTLPAHIRQTPDYNGLPDVDFPVPAIFSNEVAAQLAWSLYLVGDVIDAASPVIRRRVETEITRRLLDPCLERRDDLHWMGLRGETVNNWTPWSISTWMACNLLIEPDPRRRVEAVSIGLEGLDAFYRSYGPDGGCDEGPGYWNAAGGSLFEALDLLDKAVGGQMDVFGDDRIAEIGRYPLRAYIGGDWVVNFADASARAGLSAALIARFGERIADRDLKTFGQWLLARHGRLARSHGGSLARWLMATFDAPTPDGPVDPPRWPAQTYLGDIQVLCARQEGGSTDGLFLAAKGGHNAESHNHNDIGQFVVYHDRRPLLIDAGVGVYRRQTFSDRRYEIWTMVSPWHNLPTIDGVEQLPGRQYAARDVECTLTDERACLRLDLAPAYPPQAKLQSWVRTATLDRSAGAVGVEDVATFVQTPQTVEMSLLTACEVRLEPGRLVLQAVDLPHGKTTAAGTIEYDPQVWTAVRVERQDTSQDMRLAMWGERLQRIVLAAAPTGTGLRSTFTIRPA